METYNKEKLHEYATELFSLCLEKRLVLEYYSYDMEFIVGVDDEFFTTFCLESSFLARGFKGFKKVIPIWELIEKIKTI